MVCFICLVFLSRVRRARKTTRFGFVPQKSLKEIWKENLASQQQEDMVDIEGKVLGGYDRNRSVSNG